MNSPDLNYKAVIERGRTAKNDQLHDFLAERLERLVSYGGRSGGRWLDIGCNTGWLLESVPNGVGVDASSVLIEKAQAKGLTVHHARAEELPFEDISFDVAVLGSVLPNIEDWKKALSEARRVALVVIGIIPYPGSPWGKISKEHRWVRSVIDPSEFTQHGGAVERVTDTDYFFHI